jgi:hypothetical protein
LHSRPEMPSCHAASDRQRAGNRAADARLLLDLPLSAGFREGFPVSVEAISWALNLAPIPCDRGGKRNPACKAVLVGLANHAAPDGKEAFPSVRTLARYTDLSERTVRTALDRLQADGIIRPATRRSWPRRSSGPTNRPPPPRARATPTDHSRCIHVKGCRSVWHWPRDEPGPGDCDLGRG